MIQGLKNWNKKDAYFSQENNAIETYNKTQKNEGLNHWTESCGPTSCINILASMGIPFEKKFGDWTPQPEDILFLYLNDPRNVDLWELRKDIQKNIIPGNRIPQFYPKAVKSLFSVDAEFKLNMTFQEVAIQVVKGIGIQICLRNPGHYMAVVAYDDETQELIVNDPFGSRWPDGNGFNRRLSKQDFQVNVQNFFIVYKGVV